MIIVLFGPPGVGKGTQGMKLAEKMNLAQFVMGDILREAVSEQTPTGLKAREYMDSGRLVPDDIVIGLIEERITGDEAANGFILDGFPRNVPQAEALARMLERHGMSIDRAVFLDAPEQALLERLSGRLLCRSCGFGFHRHYSPPLEEGRCDKCGGELDQRDDDREDVVAERLRVYREQTAPLLDHYRGSPAFRHVNAGGEMQGVFAELTKAVVE